MTKREVLLRSVQLKHSYVCCMLLAACIPNGQDGHTFPAPDGKASAFLADVFDRFHETLDVYTDSGAAGNHFAARGRLSSPGDEGAVPPMDEACTVNPQAGITCIEATFKASGQNWGGWYFMNGVLLGSDVRPRENWGDHPDAGVDLRGATELTFWARGAKGGERVEFFCLGVGRDPITGQPTAPFPDSSPKRSTGYVTLAADWREYSLRLTEPEADLGYALGGFGWITSAPQNGNANISFYIDDVQYDRSRLTEPRFALSYETIISDEEFDSVMRNAAFLYDNSVVLLALLASGDTDRARLLASAICYAVEHDRFYEADGRLRNAYQAGDLTLPPGWTPNGRADTVRIPGWYDTQSGMWLEDDGQVSIGTGPCAWAMIALEAAFEILGEERFVRSAELIGEWIEEHCRDERGAGGYSAGLSGWEPNPTPLTYKATEHQIDLTVAFRRLGLITGDEIWHERADHARGLLDAMWDPIDGKWWIGTEADGTTINTRVVALDVQAWGVLAICGDERSDCLRALEYAEEHHGIDGGFDFNEDLDGVWNEGTAHMAVAYHVTKQSEKWHDLVTMLGGAQSPSGGLPAADRDGLTTGLDLPSGEPFLYFDRIHSGATAWLVLAQQGVNPFWLGDSQ